MTKLSCSHEVVTIITEKYPEILTSARECLKGCKSTIIDGEIVVLDENGIPSFQAHQRRMNVESKKKFWYFLPRPRVLSMHLMFCLMSIEI